jgi:hypothetical protein
MQYKTISIKRERDIETEAMNRKNVTQSPRKNLTILIVNFPSKQTNWQAWSERMTKL